MGKILGTHRIKNTLVQRCRVRMRNQEVAHSRPFEWDYARIRVQLPHVQDMTAETMAEGVNLRMLLCLLASALLNQLKLLFLSRKGAAFSKTICWPVA